jgi:hypothetical protein
MDFGWNGKKSGLYNCEFLEMVRHEDVIVV